MEQLVPGRHRCNNCQQLQESSGEKEMSDRLFLKTNGLQVLWLHESVGIGECLMIWMMYQVQPHPVSYPVSNEVERESCLLNFVACLTLALKRKSIHRSIFRWFSAIGKMRTCGPSTGKTRTIIADQVRILPTRHGHR